MPGTQVIFLKGRNDVYSAKVAIDDVELTDCDLHLPSSECPQVRCGNGVCSQKNLSNLLHSLIFRSALKMINNVT